MKFILFLIALFTSHYLIAATNDKGGGELLNSKGSSVELETFLFQSIGQYDTAGTETSLEDGTGFSLIDVNLAVRYGLAKNLELGALGRFRTLRSAVNDVTLSNSGPESLGIIVKYSLPKINNTFYAIGLHYRQTLHTSASFDSSVQIPAETLILGDSGSEYGVDLFVTNYSSSLKWDFKLGYSSPANDLSSEIHYQAQMIYHLSKVGLFIGTEGISSLKKDEYTNLPSLKPYQATGAAKLFNSINRENISPYLGINFSYDQMLFSLKGQTVISGKSTDKGNSISLNFSWSSRGLTDESLKIESFKEYIVDGSVLKVSARGNFIRIDQGLSTDVEKGMKFDVYQTDYFGGNVLVASGVIFDVGVDWSVIKLTKRYNEIEIKPGFAARGY